MANMKDLKRQHKEIFEIINYLKSSLQEDKVKLEAAKLAQSINIIAGKLKIHLIAEDDILYPQLLAGEDIRSKEIARNFSNEMGNLAAKFTDYKNKYNTSSKILKDIDGYINNTKTITDALFKRMSREDNELYTLL